MDITQKERDAFIVLLEKNYEDMIQNTHPEDLPEKKKAYITFLDKVKKKENDDCIKDTIYDIFGW